MKSTPYELVFGQPPRQNIFPGVTGTRIMEEDVEDILEEEKENESESGLDDSEPRKKTQAEGGNDVEKENVAEETDAEEGNEKADILEEEKENDSESGPDDSKPRTKTQAEEGNEKADSDTEKESNAQKENDKEKGKEIDPEMDSDLVLGNSQKHLKLRKEADERYRQNAERMRLKYAKAKRKKVMTFNPGDFVSIRIPRIDRTSTDFHRVPCVVVERLGSEFHLYRLRYVLSLLNAHNLPS